MSKVNVLDWLDPIPINLHKIDGMDKLRRLITKEFSSQTSEDKFDNCSNLPHLISILTCVKNTANADPSSAPKAVLKPFNYSLGRSKRFIIDIVSSDGAMWSKVSARNPKSLTLLANGGGGFGQKSILDHALDYIECSKENPCFFKPPKIKFIFTSGIGASLAEQLISLGITVEGEIIQDSELRVHPKINSYQEYQEFQAATAGKDDPENPDDDKSAASPIVILKNPNLESLDNIKRLNLDITVLLAYVSNLTNGHTNVSFSEKNIQLTEQLEFEKKRPQKPILDKIFSGRELWCCETAIREFQSILSTVGGKLEKDRANEFLKRVKIVPDQMSERSKSLDVSGNIKSRSLTIFGTGDYYEAVTVTANTGFVRSSKTQGIDFPVFLHESRALTEDKEKIIPDWFYDQDHLIICQLSSLSI